MSNDLIWLIAGLVLVIAELASGTFYLLVLGIAALGGSVTAFAGGSLLLQSIVAAIIAIAGVMWVRSRPRMMQSPAMPSIDAGQMVSFESWSDQRAGRARVRYRDAQWDAVIEGEAGTPARGDAFYIVAMEGNTLRVSARHP